ncbi:MAG TPA: hypothetical protein VMQ62_06995 [Dongiaceae bacterium]|nr:hypothetical protein [Dongiaceae bacterium]
MDSAPTVDAARDRRGPRHRLLHVFWIALTGAAATGVFWATPILAGGLGGSPGGRAAGPLAVAAAAAKPTPPPPTPPQGSPSTPPKDKPSPRPGVDPRPPREKGSGVDSAAPGPAPEIAALLASLGEKAATYESIALRFVCLETIRDSEHPNKSESYDYMYVESEAQRYRPYRQKHDSRDDHSGPEVDVDQEFPDAYSWTLIFSPARQHLFKFEYVGDEWFALRHAYVIKFTAPLPYTSGRTIYEWSGKVWVDAENYNFLKVEAEPADQEDRLAQALREYRQATRFLIFQMAHKPAGGRYSITFLNDYRRLSLPDEAEHQTFLVDGEGNRELTSFLTQRYSQYQFFGVELRDRFLK